LRLRPAAHWRRSRFLVDDHFVDVGFPGDFPPTRPLAPGVYTVLWHNGGFLACDGFVIR